MTTKKKAKKGLVLSPAPGKLVGDLLDLMAEVPEIVVDMDVHKYLGLPVEGEFKVVDPVENDLGELIRYWVIAWKTQQILESVGKISQAAKFCVLFNLYSSIFWIAAEERYSLNHAVASFKVRATDGGGFAIVDCTKLMEKEANDHRGFLGWLFSQIAEGSHKGTLDEGGDDDAKSKKKPTIQ